MRDRGDTPKFLGTGNLSSNDFRGTWLDERMIKAFPFERLGMRLSTDR